MVLRMMVGDGVRPREEGRVRPPDIQGRGWSEALRSSTVEIGLLRPTACYWRPGFSGSVETTEPIICVGASGLVTGSVVGNADVLLSTSSSAD